LRLTKIRTFFIFFFGFANFLRWCVHYCFYRLVIDSRGLFRSTYLKKFRVFRNGYLNIRLQYNMSSLICDHNYFNNGVSQLFISGWGIDSTYLQFLHVTLLCSACQIHTSIFGKPFGCLVLIWLFRNVSSWKSLHAYGLRVLDTH
jgi:hypothetical protein